jgi:hypothetical protein
LKIIIMSLLSTLLSLVAGKSSASAEPAQIVLLRHAEKPPQGAELSEKGWARARALPQVFNSNPQLKMFKTPAALFGMSPSRPGRSVRSIQTLTPLSEATRVNIETQFRGRDFRRLVETILSTPEYDRKQVVICWRREEIPAILEEFGVGPTRDVGQNQYDLIWILTPDHDGNYAVSIGHQNG